MDGWIDGWIGGSEFRYIIEAGQSDIMPLGCTELAPSGLDFFFLMFDACTMDHGCKAKVQTHTFFIHGTKEREPWIGEKEERKEGKERRKQ